VRQRIVPEPLRLGLVLSGCVTALAACGGEAAAPARPAPALRLAAPVSVRLGGAPVAIALSRRNAWVADNTAGTVRRLDLRSARPVGAAARVGRGPVALAVGEGGVWVATGADAVRRLDPASGRVTGPPVAVRDPNGIVAAAGSVWVTGRLAGTVTRIDPRTTRVVGRPIRVGRAPADVAVGFGSVWVANADDGTVSRLDARTGRPVGKAIKVGLAQVFALTVGRDAVWVATNDLRKPGQVALRRIDPRSGAVADTGVAVPAGVPVDLASGFGRVWATDVGSLLPGSRRPAVVRGIDTAGRRVERPTRVGESPAAVAVGAGAVWTADAGDGTVTRIAVGR
jgi:streptogramin lyase